MTGYGRARETRSGRDITVEVRSVNNRYLDCTVKMPRAYIFAEDAVKARVQKAVSRGKVDVFITIDAAAADETVVAVNEPLARGYYEALTRLKDMFSLEDGLNAVTLAKFPDVLTVTKAEEDLESVAADICAVLDEALAAYNAMRTVEGGKLREDIAGRADTIEAVVGKVEERSPQVVDSYREKLEAKVHELLEDSRIEDSRIAAENFWRAAEQGNVDAAYRLACMYRDGVGMDRDPAKAYHYFTVAGSKGEYKDAARQADALRQYAKPVPRRRAAKTKTESRSNTAKSASKSAKPTSKRRH